MLIFPALRILALLLLAGSLIDAAYIISDLRGWRWDPWDTKPDLPAGYFTLLRLVISVSATWDAWAHSRYARLGVAGSDLWGLVLLVTAMIFQPMIPLHLEYSWWNWIDLTALIVLSIHAYLVTLPIASLIFAAVMRGQNPLTVSGVQFEAATISGYLRAATLFVRPLSDPAGAMNPAGTPVDPKVPPTDVKCADDPPSPMTKGKLAGSKSSSGGMDPADPRKPILSQIAIQYRVVVNAEARLSRPDISQEERRRLERIIAAAELVIADKVSSLPAFRPTDEA